MRRSKDEILDEALVLAAQAGDPRALAGLVERWQGRMGRFLQRRLGAADRAADALQETWLAVTRGIPRLDDPGRFRAWIYRIALTKAQDAQRQGARRSSAALDENLADEPPADADEATRALLEGLEPSERLLLELVYLQGLSLPEVSEVLALKVGTVKSRLSRLRERLRQNLRSEA